MADVFISYAREDVATVERLVAAIEGLGLSVWWDRRIGAGADFQERIEEELNAAKAVVAVWSAASVSSKYVRAEALEAFDQDKLAPIALDATRPPLFFRGVQFEDFSNWSGESSAMAFQDLATQLIALCRGQEEASRAPRDHRADAGIGRTAGRAQPEPALAEPSDRAVQVRRHRARGLLRAQRFWSP